MLFFLYLISCYLWIFLVTEDSVANMYFSLQNCVMKTKDAKNIFACVFFLVLVLWLVSYFSVNVDHVRIICKEAPFLYLLDIIISCGLLHLQTNNCR